MKVGNEKDIAMLKSNIHFFTYHDRASNWIADAKTTDQHVSQFRLVQKKPKTQ